MRKEGESVVGGVIVRGKCLVAWDRKVGKGRRMLRYVVLEGTEQKLGEE